jgi:hypothetical protein
MHQLGMKYIMASRYCVIGIRRDKSLLLMLDVKHLRDSVDKSVFLCYTVYVIRKEMQNNVGDAQSA